MAHKSKQIIWHKKSGKIVPPKFLKAHGKKVELEALPFNGTGDKTARLRNFALKLKAQIKNAAGR